MELVKVEEQKSVAVSEKMKTIIPESIAQKLNKQQRELVEAKFSDKKVETEKDFRVCVLFACTVHSIVGDKLPTVSDIAYLFSQFQKRYAERINLQEFKLAFEMHVWGELGAKFEHYQCFSPEFMQSVLGKYLEQRGKAVVKFDQEKIALESQSKFSESDIIQTEIKLLNEIKTDYENLKNGAALSESDYMVSSKLENVYQIFGIEFDEITVAAFRESAALNVLSYLRIRRKEERSKNGFGSVLALENQIARIKAGKWITEEDEARIQNEVKRQLYVHVLKQGIDSEILKQGIDENIKLLTEKNQ